MNEGERDRPPDRFEESEDEGEEVVLAQEDISEGFRLCAKSLIGRIFADRIFSEGTMENALRTIWSRPDGFRVQFWGLPEQFKTLEIGRKLARQVGDVLEVDLFEVKGKENRIMKARVELNGLKKVRDSLKLSGLNLVQTEVGLRYERIGVVCLYCAKLGHTSRNCQTLLEDLQQNRVRQEALGEWIKADQVGKRIFSKEFKTAESNDRRDWNQPQPEKKPTPDWLTDGFSKLNLKENLQKEDMKEVNQTEQEDKG
ncbi:hypothetical protein PIB30_053858 [Stylosanthes scabra]|uniref:CCHC-type domain-containing protein n=1 Tax=Stylosanthes scabra TaxID=79078 RepID=A0ABU6YHF9_9FABA|nr:hypothetical protein [Stylosanthes scabra]